MALIKCPECGKDISDKAPACIHCGYPLKEYVNELRADTTQSVSSSNTPVKTIPKLDLDTCPLCGSSSDKFRLVEDEGSYVCGVCGYVYQYDSALYNSVENQRKRAEEAAQRDAEIRRKREKNELEEKWKKWREEKNKVHCPKCGSSSITTGARGVNGIFGFIGASKTVNRCAKCGYTWAPKG